MQRYEDAECFHFPKFFLYPDYYEHRRFRNVGAAEHSFAEDSDNYEK
jgi:hypothetical protein